MSQRLVLGIDPGLNITGYGVLDIGSPEPTLVEAGVLRTSRSDHLPLRLETLYRSLREVLGSFNFEAVAMEELYSHYKRPTTAIMMGHARGVLCLAAGQAGVPLFSYGATQVKKMLTGNGRAGKAQVQMAISRQLNLPAVPEPPDVADALAIAMCHHFLNSSSASLT